MLNIIKSFFKKSPTLTGRQINMWEHKSWGNSVNWMDFKTRDIYGHLQNRPTVGDIINCQMESGKIAQFIVDSVEYMRDPDDMFFCKVSDFGNRE